MAGRDAGGDGVYDVRGAGVIRIKKRESDGERASAKSLSAAG